MADLNRLIDEVLNMVKESHQIRKKKSEEHQPSWYGGNKDEAEYWKDIRERNTSLEKQRLANEGAANVATIGDVGATARQKLSGQSQENVANITAGAHRYGADMGFKGEGLRADATKYTADQNVKAAGLKGGEGRSGDDLRTQIIVESIKAGVPFDEAMNNANRAIAKPADEKDEQFKTEDSPFAGVSTAAPVATASPVLGREPSGSPSILDIDREISEENKKKKYVDNRLGNWAIKRAKNITMAVPRAMGAGMERARRIGKGIVESEIWDE